MDSDGAITYLARAEGRLVRPLREHEEEAPDDGVPRVHISACGDVRGSGHEGHDNEGRMAHLCAWLRDRVLPLCALPVKGTWRAELHDSYAYLPGDKSRFDNCWTYSRPCDARERAALIPDPYQVDSYGGLLDASARDATPWASKRSHIFFAGTTTGDTDPRLNERVRAAVWSLDHPADATFRITKIAQMDAARAFAAVPRLREAVAEWVPPAAQFGCRYLANIAGNTAAWARAPMILASQSLMLNLRHPDAMWYAPVLRAGEHYVDVPALDGMLAAKRRMDAAPAEARRMVEAANGFAASYLRPEHADVYMAQLLEASFDFSAP